MPGSLLLLNFSSNSLFIIFTSESGQESDGGNTGAGIIGPDVPGKRLTEKLINKLYQTFLYANYTERTAICRFYSLICGYLSFKFYCLLKVSLTLTEVSKQTLSILFLAYPFR